MPGPAFIEGDRITLRPVERDDADFLQRGWTDPAIRVQFGVGYPRNRAQIEARIEQAIEGGDSITLFACLDSEPIGVVTAKDFDQIRPELACWVVPEHHGKGYGTEANSLFIDYLFETFEKRGLMARAYASNEPSCTVLEKLGFTREGTLREHRFVEGEYVDAVLYGLLREEWVEDR